MQSSIYSGRKEDVQIGEWLKAARKEAGLSYEKAAYLLHGELPESMWVGMSTVRRMEHEPNEELHPLVVAGLARVYGVGGPALPAEVTAQVGQLRELLDALSRWTSNSVAA